MTTEEKPNIDPESRPALRELVAFLINIIKGKPSDKE